MMKEYQRTKLIITEFEAEDVITTSGVNVPDDPNRTVTMNSPGYSNSERTPGGWNWTLWQ